jgi:hypothetical protein
MGEVGKPVSLQEDTDAWLLSPVSHCYLSGPPDGVQVQGWVSTRERWSGRANEDQGLLQRAVRVWPPLGHVRAGMARLASCDLALALGARANGGSPSHHLRPQETAPASSACWALGRPAARWQSLAGIADAIVPSIPPTSNSSSSSSSALSQPLQTGLSSPTEFHIRPKPIGSRSEPTLKGQGTSPWKLQNF